MSVSNVKPHHAAGEDWRAAEADHLDARAARLRECLNVLAELEVMEGDREGVAHECRALAARLRTIRTEDIRRSELLRAAIRELEHEARAATEPLASRRA